MKDDSQNQELTTEAPKEAEEKVEVVPDDTYPAPNFSPEPISSSSYDQELKAPSSATTTPEEPSNEGSAPFSSVATTAGSKKFLLMGIGGLVAVAAYFIAQEIASDNKVEKTPSEKIQERSQSDAQKLIKDAKPISNADDVRIAPQVPQLPAELPIQAPQPPEPPPPPVPAVPQAPIFPQVNQPTLPTPFSPEASTAPDIFSSKENDEARLKALEARRKASIMVLGGKSALDESGDEDKEKKREKEKEKEKDKASFLGFGEGAFGGAGLAKTKANQVKATQIGDLGSMIAQGKVINAILETAINTDLPGTLRAIITRDVYAENGNAVLIPKGSRVIGKYETEVKSGQTRVAVMWNRLIRPDGVDIAIDSQGTDTLGRSGIAGYLDDKLLTKLGNAFLISFVVPAVVDKLFKVKGANDPVQTTTSTNALLGPTISTTKTTTFKQEQVKQSAEKFNEILSKTIQDTFATTPTIFVDQGTEINIFVNRDLLFPPESIIGGSKLIR